MSDYSIAFPHLHIYLDHVGKNFSIGGFEIAFYGLVIAAGMLIAFWYIQHEAKRTGQNEDDYFTMTVLGILFGVIGARLYYVVFSWDSYKDDLLQIFNIRQGGLAIYGGIIFGCLTVVAVCRWKKIRFSLAADTVIPGVLIGQIMGRWGNFFNREAFGDYTDNLFAMRLPVSAVRRSEITQAMWDHAADGYIQVHPTFLYESLWNLAILAGLMLYKKHKKFDGELFALYLLFYGMGRAWIEGLRTDQLLIFGFPVSQLLSVVLILTALIWLFMGYRSYYKSKGVKEVCGDKN